LVRAIITPVRFAKSAKHSASIGPSFPDRRAASKDQPLSTIAGTTHAVCFPDHRNVGVIDAIEEARFSVIKAVGGNEVAANELFNEEISLICDWMLRYYAL